MRILVVEDEPDLLRAVPAALRKEGYANIRVVYLGLLAVILALLFVAAFLARGKRSFAEVVQLL